MTGKIAGGCKSDVRAVRADLACGTIEVVERTAVSVLAERCVRDLRERRMRGRIVEKDFVVPVWVAASQVAVGNKRDPCTVGAKRWRPTSRECVAVGELSGGLCGRVVKKYLRVVIGVTGSQIEPRNKGDPRAVTVEGQSRKLPVVDIVCTGRVSDLAQRRCSRVIQEQFIVVSRVFAQVPIGHERDPCPITADSRSK